MKVICGFNGSGKTYVLNKLAEVSEFKQVDSDVSFYTSLFGITSPRAISFLKFVSTKLPQAVDDVAEGLDVYESIKLAKALSFMCKELCLNTYFATNNSHFINACDIEQIMFVHNKSIYDTKEMYHAWELKGLNNYDLLTSGVYLEYGGREV